MAYKLVVFAAFVAVARAGVVPAVGPAYAAPAYATHAYAAHAAPLAYAAPAVAKVATYSHAPVAYAAHAAPVAYAAHAAPVAYAAHAAPVAYAHAPVAKVVAQPVVKAIDTDYDPNPSYSYAYDVQDALTGDSKNQQESRQGDVVQGSYSLTEPDGTRRTVEYTADPHNGFNAVVHREPAVVHKAVAPVAVAAPVAKFAAPVAYAAPVAKVAAPVAYAAHAAPVAYAHHAPLAYAHAAPAIAYHH